MQGNSTMNEPYAEIISIIRRHYPAVQAIYLFGTYGTADEWPTSDVDLAVLLPRGDDKAAGDLGLSPCATELSLALHKEVDLLNARQVYTVFQKEIVMADRRIFCADVFAADEFEMLAISMYVKLSEERAGILEAADASGRYYDV